MSSIPQTELFGGAMSCHIPSSFVDVAYFRRVPDNQEVYVDEVERTFSVEIMEHDDQPGDVLQRAFEEMASANEAKTWAVIQQITSITTEQAPFLVPTPNEENTNIRAHRVGVLLGTQSGIIKFHEHNQDVIGNSVRIWLALAELPQYNADIIISLTDPTFVSTLSSSATKSLPPQPLEIADAIFTRVLETFQIHDASLFA